VAQTNPLYDFIYVAGILVLLSYLYIVFKSKERDLSRLLLLVIFTVLLAVVLESYAQLNQLGWITRIVLVPAMSSKLLLPPLLFLYVRSLFYGQQLSWKQIALHCSPFILGVLFLYGPYLIALESRNYFQAYLVFLDENRQYLRILFDLYFLMSIGFTFREFSRLKRIYKCTYSHLEYNNFIWIRAVLISFFVVLSIDLFFVISQVYFGLFTWRTQSLVAVLVVIAVVQLAFYGIRQSKVLVPYFLLETPPQSNSADLTFEEKQLEADLIELMEKEKPFLNEELTLSELAEVLGITDKKLSRLLNQGMKTSFYRFVNAYRLAEFKQKIGEAKSQQYTIESVAFECGFKSKASFYRLFKEEMGVSPSAYRKNLTIPD